MAFILFCVAIGGMIGAYLGHPESTVFALFAGVAVGFIIGSIIYSFVSDSRFGSLSGGRSNQQHRNSDDDDDMSFMDMDGDGMLDYFDND